MPTIVEYVINFREKAKGIKSAQQNADKLDRKVKNVNKSLKTGAVIAASVAALAVGRYVADSINAFDKQEKAIAQVNQGIISTGGVAGRSLDQLKKQASALQRDTIFGDEDILSGVTAQLLTFTNVAGKQFDRLQVAALDLATRLDADLKSTTIQLGKALNDPVANLSALSRSGIQFSKEQKTVIKRLVETNKLAKAQDLILTELEKQYGGSAAAAAKAGKGGLQQLSNTLGDIKEVIGGALLPIINVFAGVIRGLADLIMNNETTFRILIQTLGILAAAMGVALAVTKLWTVAIWAQNAALLANPIGAVLILLAGLIAALVTAYNKSEQFREAVHGLWGGFKGLFNFLKAFALPIFTALIDKIKEIGVRVKEFLQKPIEKARERWAQFLDLLAKIPGVSKLIKGLRDSFSKGFKKGVADFRKEQEKVKLGAQLAGGANIPGPAGTTPGATPGKSKTDTITSAAPKVFNINIDKLVDKFTVEVNNTLTEATDEVKNLITQTLLEAVADVEISR